MAVLMFYSSYPARYGRLPPRSPLPGIPPAAVETAVVAVPLRRDRLGHEVSVALVAGDQVADEPSLELVPAQVYYIYNVHIRKVISSYLGRPARNGELTTTPTPTTTATATTTTTTTTQSMCGAFTVVTL